VRANEPVRDPGHGRDRHPALPAIRDRPAAPRHPGVRGAHRAARRCLHHARAEPGQLFGGTAASRRAGRSPASPWPWPPLVQPARRRIQEASTAASTGAVTTRPGRSRRPVAACASRPTSPPWPPSSWRCPPVGGAHHGVALAWTLLAASSGIAGARAGTARAARLGVRGRARRPRAQGDRRARLVADCLMVSSAGPLVA
jgi:hypothetical protein